MKLPTTPPPALPGYQPIRGIGAGGFADVFLYQQQAPRRNVAIKVLRPEFVTPYSVDDFRHEADTMASISEHAYIVQVHTWGVVPEDDTARVPGQPPPDPRPFIVMEHYPNDHFGLRSRTGTLQVPQVLEVAVQVASAVATAHQFGILHRDIKPDNILTSRANKPGLTDFGIASVSRPGATTGASGFTPEYAAPEVMEDVEARGSVHADIYALGATIYTLLQGRPPFVVEGEPNDVASLLQRARHEPVPPITRPIPDQLQFLLANCLHPDVGSRPESALDLIGYLHQVQMDLHLPTTPIETLEAVETLDPGPGTITPPIPPHLGVRGTINPQAGAPAAPPSWPEPDPGPEPAAAPADRTRGPRPAPPAEDTRRPAAPASPPDGPGQPPDRSSGPAELTRPPGAAPAAPPAEDTRRPAAPPPVPQPVPAPDPGSPSEAASPPAPAVVLLLAVIIVLGLVVGGGSGSDDTGDATTSTGVVMVLPPEPPNAVELRRGADGVPVVRWQAPDGYDDLRRRGFDVVWFPREDPADERLIEIEGAAPTEARLSGAPEGPVCVQVRTTDGVRVSDNAPAAPACEKD